MAAVLSPPEQKVILRSISWELTKTSSLIMWTRDPR